MKFVYYGHNYIYAVEQMAASLFPVTEDTSESTLVTRLSRGGAYTTATCLYNGSFRGRASVKNESVNDSTAQAAIKTAIYRAVRRSGKTRPPWGALSGVRPGKLMAGLMDIKEFQRRFDVTPERARLCYETSLHTLAARDSLSAKDICLYVGIPFCPTRCAYCSFVSQSVEKSLKLIAPFLEALFKELEATARQVQNCGLKVVSIYFGGGTPTTLSAQQLDSLCSFIESRFDLSLLREFCVEAGRPDTIDAAKLEALKKHGVNRLSVNPQSMSDSVLKAIGRRHSADDVIRAFSLVKSAGGFDINADLIAGLPSDSPESFRRSIDTVLSLAPENITVHTLSLKRGSGLLLGGYPLPNAAETAAMLDYAYSALRSSGFEPYYLYRQKNMSGGFENTGWTLPGHENLYNICMMEELCTILAAGGGGSSKLILPGNGKNLRITTPKYPLEYIQQIDKTCADKERIGNFYV